MHSVNIAVMPKDGESKIPINVAGEVMIGIQDILTHIGEYIITKELKLQNPIPGKFSDMFTLYMDPNGGVSLRTSSISTSGIVDDALTLMERLLAGLGSGAGGYWIDDTFTDPRFRRIVVEDVIDLASKLKDEFYLKFSDGIFDSVNVPKLKEYLSRITMTTDNATCGIIRRFTSRSGREDGLRLETSGDRVRMTFLTREMEELAQSLVDKGVIVAGRIKYFKDGISEVTDIGQVVTLDGMKFKRMVSVDGDVKLTSSVKADISYSNDREEWNFRNDALGMNISKGTWDEAMISFHDYFVFLWNTYSVKLDDDLSSEDIEVKRILRELVVS